MSAHLGSPVLLCGKAKIVTKAQAKRAARQLRRHCKTAGYYKCETCGFFHITHRR